MKQTKYKHVCDKCGSSTIMIQDDRRAWYKYKNESMCAACFRNLPKQDREDASNVASLMLKVYFESFRHWITMGEEGTTSYKATAEENELLKRFCLISEEGTELE